jgi:hypothetical protein
MTQGKLLANLFVLFFIFHLSGIILSKLFNYYPLYLLTGTFFFLFLIIDIFYYCFRGLRRKQTTVSFKGIFSLLLIIIALAIASLGFCMALSGFPYYERKDPLGLGHVFIFLLFPASLLFFQSADYLNNKKP